MGILTIAVVEGVEVLYS